MIFPPKSLSANMTLITLAYKAGKLQSVKSYALNLYSILFFFLHYLDITPASIGMSEA